MKLAKCRTVVVASGERRGYITAYGNKIGFSNICTGLTIYFKISEEIGLKRTIADSGQMNTCRLVTLFSEVLEVVKDAISIKKKSMHIL